ncbi:hypothetical protein GT042_27780, partial [Streptomyces sp. SID3212]|nr:hypothetical protein [Streptomyces sp. SID3212]
GAHQPLPPAQPLPEEASSPDSTQGRAFNVRTLGQGVPFSHQQPAQPTQGRGQSLVPGPVPVPGPQGQPAQPPVAHVPSAPPTQAPVPAQTPAPAPAPAHHQSHSQGQGQALQSQSQGQGQGLAHTQGQGQGHGDTQGGQAHSSASGSPSGTLGSGRRRKLGTPPDSDHPEANQRSHPQGSSRLPTSHPEGRSYAIGAPDEGAEGPQPLDGPGGAVEVANRPQPRPVDDELPPEPLDNPRRLLVWPAPDVSTSQALSDRGYRPVVVHSREEVDAQIAAFPAALFVDPLTGPITRTALQSLRQAAVAAEVPVLVTAGLGQATREAAYGADPAVLLKALAPRDSEQHPPRVLLVEEHDEIALALTDTLERRGMQVARAATDDQAVALAGQMRPNLVVMDLMQVRRQRAGIIDWLRANGQLNRTPLVVYTSVGIDPAELPRLSSGETVLFLAERSTSDEVQSRIVELLAKIGTN